MLECISCLLVAIGEEVGEAMINVALQGCMRNKATDIRKARPSSQQKLSKSKEPGIRMGFQMRGNGFISGFGNIH